MVRLLLSASVQLEARSETVASWSHAMRVAALGDNLFLWWSHRPPPWQAQWHEIFSYAPARLVRPNHLCGRTEQ